MSGEQKRGIRVSQAELMCKDGCGYYGNPAWQGYCSKCWREKNRKNEGRGAEEGRGHRLSGDGSGAFTFSKFEDKKSVERNRRSSTVMKLLWGSPSNTRTDSPLGQDAALEEFEKLEPGDFPAFLKLLHKPCCKRLQSRCTAFLNTIQAYQTLPVGKQSDLVQDFYQNISAHFGGLSEERASLMMQHVEKLLMTRLHSCLFCHDSSDDEQRDLTLQRRIKSLNWVTADMLRVPYPESHSDLTDPYLPAITAIIEMDAKRAPQDKLACLSRCCQKILEALAASGSGPADADALLSALVLVVLRANPPRLHSNVNYVSRFALPHCVRAGHSAYYFTNLSCAVAFIEKLDGPDLGLTAEEFARYMRQGRGGSAPEESAARRRARQNLQLLDELQKRQESVDQAARLLQEQMEQWLRSLRQQMDELDARETVSDTRPVAEATGGSP